MTPTSPLAGLLTGLLDGGVIAALVLLLVVLNSRRHRAAPAVRPVAEDLPPQRTTSETELPPAG